MAKLGGASQSAGDSQQPAHSRFPKTTGEAGCVCRARATWLRSATWIRATGRPISKAAREFGYTPAVCDPGFESDGDPAAELALRLGIVTGRDLAQACREHYPRPVSFGLWILCEIAIAACDLAEVIGSAHRAEPAVSHPAAAGRVPDRLDVLLCCCCNTTASAALRRWSCR